VALHAPADRRLTPEEALQVLRELDPAITPAPQAPAPYFVRALVRASAGQWEEARLDLGRCRALLGREELSATEPAFAAWVRQANAATTLYLDATQDVLALLPVPPELRIRLGEDVQRRLADSATVMQEGLSDDELRQCKGRAHVRLARAYAAKGDRTATLKQIEEALKLKLPDVKAAIFRDETGFEAWKDDPEFVKLYDRESDEGK
jgi:hypothetical protein